MKTAVTFGIRGESPLGNSFSVEGIGMFPFFWNMALNYTENWRCVKNEFIEMNPLIWKCSIFYKELVS